MKILLINPPEINIIPANTPEMVDKQRGKLPPLGLLYLAAYLEKYTNHQIKVIDCPTEETTYQQLEEAIKQENPDIVGVTIITFTLIDVLKTLKIVKKVNPEIKTIVGGPHVHIYPEETLGFPEVDFAILGEGEIPIKNLVDNINKPEILKNIKGIAFRLNGEIINNGCQELIQDLDSLPFPARHLTNFQKYFSVLASQTPVTTMFTSRGCPYRCLFCERPHLGKNFRARGAKNVVDEMEQCQNLGIKEIFIYDDTFSVNRQRVIEICQEILKRNLKIKWDVRTRVDTVDEELLKIMKQAGCLRIHYGIEAGTTKILKVLRKGITLEKAKETFALTRKQGIYNLAYFTIGSPTETKKDILETIRFAKELNPDFVHFSITTPFPATDLYRMGLEEGVIPKDYWQEFAKNPKEDFQAPFWEKEFSRQELIRLLKKAYFSFYFRPKYILKQLTKLGSPKELIRKTKAASRLFLSSIDLNLKK